jgi:LAGLIDADG endonuclease
MTKFDSCGSSETIRKAPTFFFDDFYQYGHSEHVPRISENFLEWFIGFFEGDGYLGYTKKRTFERSRNGKVYTESACEQLRFSIVQKEKKIIEKIAYTFGLGRVSYFTKNKISYWQWTLESKTAIERMSFLLSGNLILKKRQQQFLEWIERGQKKGMFQAPFDKNKPWSSEVGLNNGWLSGFIDAEGCFYAYFKLTPVQKKRLDGLPFSKKKWSNQHHELFKDLARYKVLQLNQKMSITQYSTNQTNDTFERIALLFEGKKPYVFKNNTVQKSTNYSYVRIEFGRLSSQKRICDYLVHYPLQTMKHVSFRRWWRVYLRRKNGIHLTPKGTKRLYRLVKAINVHAKALYNKSFKEE